MRSIRKLFLVLMTVGVTSALAGTIATLYDEYSALHREARLALFANERYGASADAFVRQQALMAEVRHVTRWNLFSYSSEMTRRAEFLAASADLDFALSMGIVLGEYLMRTIPKAGGQLRQDIAEDIATFLLCFQGARNYEQVVVTTGGGYLAEVARRNCAGSDDCSLLLRKGAVLLRELHTKRERLDKLMIEVNDLAQKSFGRGI